MTERDDRRRDGRATDGSRGDPGSLRALTRRPLVRWGAVALVVAAIVLVPAYLAGRPGFFSRFPALATEYRTWSTSTHAETGCESCHVEPGLVERSLGRVRVAGAVYLSFLVPSRASDAFPSPANRACLVCHSDLRTVSPKGDLRIPHRAHVSILKMRCVECHAYLVHRTSPEGRHVPPMSACLRCHDGDRAKDACSACHTEKGAPASHRAPGWLVAHGHVADRKPCDACHRWSPTWCADCHSQRPRSHGRDWRAVHGLRLPARRGCEACHRGPFCVRCHGEVPRAGLDPTLRLVR